MGLRDWISRAFSSSKALYRWHEPVGSHVAAGGDWLRRLALVLAASAALTGLLPVLFGLNNAPPSARWAAPFGLLFGGGIAAPFLLLSGDNASGQVREEGIYRKRVYASLPRLGACQKRWPNAVTAASGHAARTESARAG